MNTNPERNTNKSKKNKAFITKCHCCRKKTELKIARNIRQRDQSPVKSRTKIDAKVKNQRVCIPFN